MLKMYKIVIAFLSVVILSMPAWAATLDINPSSGSYTIGDTFSVDVNVSSLDQAINAVAGFISFPRNGLEVESISKDESILTIWAKEPSFAVNGCSVEFQGALLNPGFTGENGKLITINFRVEDAGLTRLNTSSSMILANDGSGTNVLENSIGAFFNLLAPEGEEFFTSLSSSFPDIVHHWSEEKVNILTRACIIEGHSDGNFGPDDNTNRAQAAVLLCRITHDNTTATFDPFSDAGLDNWYGNCVSSLKESGIVGGYADGTYRPDATITRAEFLAIAMRSYEKLMGDIDKSIAPKAAYADLKTDWYTPIVNAATELGFVEGKKCASKKCFYADENITRAEAVSILFKMFSENL